MAQLVKKRRPGWVLLVVGALVASLFAVPAAAIDDDSKPNKEAATSACVAGATEDRDFPDVSEMHTFRADINCLAYYGVTIGYGDGTFGPENDVTRGQMVLFMERAAAAAGADVEAVVGDFATTGSNPVHRGDMALLIARLLVASTTDESTVNVKNNDDGTFTVVGVDAKDWDYFADARGSLNRVSDSAVSALYELGVTKGVGGGSFSPAASVNRGQMAAFITRALAHTTARPSGVSIQTDSPGEVIISVRDANFHPVANAHLDIFSISADRVGEAFKDDGSCDTGLLTAVAGNVKKCEIDALDAVTGLSGDFDPGAVTVNVKAGGTTVWAWTGESGDKVEDGGEGLASINLTKAAPVPAANAKVTTDIAKGATRVHFGSTVTVTIQLVGDAASNRADAVPDTDGNKYRVTILRQNDTDLASDDTPTAVTDSSADSKETMELKVDASGKVTFPITASDPDADDKNNPDGDPDGTPVVPNRIDRTRVTFSVETASGDRDVDDDISSTTSGSQTITFSDATAVLGGAGASIKPTAAFLTRPESGSASNVVTVTVVDQYGKPIRGHLVRLSSAHEPSTDRMSTFPVARRTDSSGSVRIGYTYTGGGSTETITVNTASDVTSGATLTPIPDAPTEDFYWAAPAAAAVTTSGTVVAADLERNIIIVVDGTNTPQLVRYDDNDQYAVGISGSESLTSMAAFEEALATDGERTAGRNDTVSVTSYDPSDSSDVARFVLTVVSN